MIQKKVARNISRRPPAFRDTDESPFTKILRDLIVRIPGAYASALLSMDTLLGDAGVGQPQLKSVP